MRRLSIKLRVTLWFTGFMLVWAAAALAVLIAMGEKTTITGAQAMLADAVTDAFRDIELVNGTLAFDDDLRRASDGAYLSVYDVNGWLLYGRLPAASLEELPFSDALHQTARADEQKWYLYDALHDVDGVVSVWVRGVMPASVSEAPFETLISLAAWMLPVFLLMATGGGYFLVSRAFMPVRRIAQTADDIGGGADLSKRIGLSSGKDELHALAATFDRMLDRLQASFESEKQFASDASHELRTPVAVIIAQCEDALQGAQTPEQARGALASVLAQARRVSALISQLLTLTRADRAHMKLQKESVDLSELTEMVAAQTEDMARARHITVRRDIQPGIVIDGDETLLMRMLLNLTENAVKYGKTNGHITIRLTRTDDRAVGEVSDDGIGIPKDQLSRVWDRFFRGDQARASGASGLGLGLPMVRYIARAHGGDTDARSVPGEGSAFTFWLPLYTM